VSGADSAGRLGNLLPRPSSIVADAWDAAAAELERGAEAPACRAASEAGASERPRRRLELLPGGAQRLRRGARVQLPDETVAG
jgi:hypothetical protein